MAEVSASGKRKPGAMDDEAWNMEDEQAEYVPEVVTVLYLLGVVIYYCSCPKLPDTTCQ